MFLGLLDIELEYSNIVKERIYSSDGSVVSFQKSSVVASVVVFLKTAFAVVLKLTTAVVVAVIT